MNIGIIENQYWIWWCRCSGALMIAMLITAVLFSVFSTHGPVMAKSTNVRVLTPVIPVGGPLRYTHDAERFESCPGEVVYTYRPLIPGQTRIMPSIVISRRALKVNETVVGRYPDYPISIETSASITPGKWNFQADMDSQCLNRRRTDTMLDFDFEVQ